VNLNEYVEKWKLLNLSGLYQSLAQGQQEKREIKNEG
jgi:hypothetical protein